VVGDDSVVAKEKTRDIHAAVARKIALAFKR
jgi:hypothetical protein